MIQKQRIAIFLPHLSGGGAERAMLKLARGLALEGFKVDLLVASATGPYLSEVPDTVNFIDFGAGPARAALGALIKYLKQYKPIALISALHAANVVAILAKRLARVPTRSILSIQNNYTAEGQITETRHDRLIRFCVARFYPWADEVVGVSQGVASDLAAAINLPPGRMRVIFNPIVSDEMLSKSLEPAEHPWLAPGQPPVLLSVGRLNPQKDYPLLLRAFAAVRSKQVCRLVILGEGEERSALEALAQELGVATDVSLPGFASNPFACMNKARLFVLSSRWEGLPTVLIEALACGCPVVSTDCPSGPGEILSGGKWGRLTPVGDMEALASAIEQSLNEPRQTPPLQSWEPYLETNAVRAFANICVAENL